ncbi:hypothetical protein Tco_0954999 [Tanacetum coccineum]|uniref:Uncharacterized protein n=1 Tax=Tanacetum coccineum TaxID=301880 RepID=A0ABQ5E628_9ASTR
MACDISWKSKMTKLSDENVLLKSQVESVVQERKNIKLEFQKQFNSIKTTRVQHQQEVNKLVKHVNQKTYAYVDVRAKNQDLLITISELKAKFAAQVKNVNTKFDKSATLEKLVCVTPLNKNKDLIATIVSKDIERIRKFFNVPDEIDEIVQPLIPEPIHTTPPNDDYVAPATKSILDELLEEFGDEILNVATIYEEADPTKDLKELERLLAMRPQSNFTEIQVDKDIISLGRLKHAKLILGYRDACEIRIRLIPC